MIVTTYQWYKGPVLPDDQLTEDGRYPQEWYDAALPIAGATGPDYTMTEDDKDYAIFYKMQIVSVE